MHICAEKNNLALMKRLMPYKPDLNVQDRLLRTPLYYAAEKSNVECLVFLLENGASPNSMDRNDSPLLYWAINFASLEVLKTLFAFGAEPDLFCGSGRRPLFKAAYLDRPDVLEWLLSIPRARQDIDLPDHKGRTALHASCIGIGAGNKGKNFSSNIMAGTVAEEVQHPVAEEENSANKKFFKNQKLAGPSSKDKILVTDSATCMKILLNAGADVRLKTQI